MEGVIVSSFVSWFQKIKNDTETTIKNQLNIPLGSPIGALPDELTRKIKDDSILSKLNEEDKPATSWDRISSLLYIFFWIFMAILAVRLSWESNTILEWNVGFKVLFALVAALFPLYYILGYFIFRYSLVKHIKNNC